MFSRILAIIRKEFIQIVRDPRTLALVLMLPLMQVILLGYAVNSDVRHIRTVVVDQARDQVSRGLVRTFTNTEYFDVVGYLDSPAELRQVIHGGGAKVGLVIPPTFAVDLKSGRGAILQVVIDGSDPSVAQTALFAANAIVQAHAAEFLAESLGRVGGRLNVPLELRPDVLYNPDMRSVNYMIPGLIGLILQFQSLLLTAFAIVRERERGTLEQLIVTPIRPWELMLGKLLPFVMIAFWNVGVAAAVGLLWFRTDFNGSFALLLVLSIVFLIGSLGLGMLVSTVSHTQAQAIQSAMFFLMPAIVLSGLIFPLENLPSALRLVAHLLPITYFLRILRGIALKGLGIEYLWGDTALLAIFGLVVFAISAARFQKRLT